MTEMVEVVGALSSNLADTIGDTAEDPAINVHTVGIQASPSRRNKWTQVADQSKQYLIIEAILMDNVYLQFNVYK